MIATPSQTLAQTIDRRLYNRLDCCRLCLAFQDGIGYQISDSRTYIICIADRLAYRFKQFFRIFLGHFYRLANTIRRLDTRRYTH